MRVFIPLLLLISLTSCADVDPLPIRVEKKLDRTAVQLSGEEDPPPDDPDGNNLRREQYQRNESWADDIR